MPSQKFVIYTDSRSAIEALQNYSSQNYLVQQIKYIFHKLKETGKNIELCWVPAHVGIRGNEEADRAAKAAIAMTKANIKIPISDFLPTLKSFIFNKWQTLWNEEPETNKLKQIKLEVTPWETSQQKDRYTEVVLTRLRIGHTRLTHGYLMSNPHDPIPECSQCKSTLTVEHFLLECPIFNQQRILCFGNNCLKEVLSDSSSFSVSSIIKFLKKCNLLEKKLILNPNSILYFNTYIF